MKATALLSGIFNDPADQQEPAPMYYILGGFQYNIIISVDTQINYNMLNYIY